MSKLCVTLDITCLTLPPDVQSVISESIAKDFRKTSFCSVSPSQLNSNDSEKSMELDEPE